MSRKVRRYFWLNGTFASSFFYWRRYSFGEREQKQGDLALPGSEKVLVFRFHAVSRYFRLLYFAAGDTLRSTIPIILVLKARSNLEASSLPYSWSSNFKFDKPQIFQYATLRVPHERPASHIESSRPHLRTSRHEVSGGVTCRHGRKQQCILRRLLTA